MDSQPAVACYLGRVAYRPTWTLQEAIKNRLIQAKKDDQLLPHILLLLEHPPVFTMGRSGDDRHLLAPGDAEVVHVDRGGDVTYHGPGQLVVYFLLDLNRFYRDLHRFMRDLEEVVLHTLREYSLVGFRIPRRTGIWVGEEGLERKICAFGIHVSRWVTTHGLALNVNPDLDYFNRITPCGIADRGVTSLVQELGRPCNTETIVNFIVHHFDEVFGTGSRMLWYREAYEYVEQFTGQQKLSEALSA